MYLFKLDQSSLMHLETNTGDYQTDIRLSGVELKQPSALFQDNIDFRMMSAVHVDHRGDVMKPYQLTNSNQPVKPIMQIRVLKLIQ